MGRSVANSGFSGVIKDSQIIEDDELFCALSKTMLSDSVAQAFNGISIEAAVDSNRPEPNPHILIDAT